MKKSKYYIRFYQNSDESASPSKRELENPQIQIPQGLERLDSILVRLEYVVPRRAPRYTIFGTASSTEGGVE